MHICCIYVHIHIHSYLCPSPTTLKMDSEHLIPMQLCVTFPSVFRVKNSQMEKWRARHTRLTALGHRRVNWLKHLGIEGVHKPPFGTQEHDFVWVPVLVLCLCLSWLPTVLGKFRWTEGDRPFIDWTILSPPGATRASGVWETQPSNQEVGTGLRRGRWVELLHSPSVWFSQILSLSASGPTTAQEGHG